MRNYFTKNVKKLKIQRQHYLAVGQQALTDYDALSSIIRMLTSHSMCFDPSTVHLHSLEMPEIFTSFHIEDLRIILEQLKNYVKSTYFDYITSYAVFTKFSRFPPTLWKLDFFPTIFYKNFVKVTFLLKSYTVN